MRARLRGSGCSRRKLMKKSVRQGVFYMALLAGFAWDVPLAQRNGCAFAQVVQDEFHSSGSSACPPQVDQEERVARLERQYRAKAIYLSVAQAQEIYRRTGGKAFYTCGSDCDSNRTVCIKKPQYEAVIAQALKDDVFSSNSPPTAPSSPKPQKDGD